MVAVMTMAKKKKKDNPTVKLPRAFKRKLQHVAVELGMDMSELVVREMEEFIEREWKKLCANKDANGSDDSPPPTSR